MDLARELKKAVEHDSNSDTNCKNIWIAWNRTVYHLTMCNQTTDV